MRWQWTDGKSVMGIIITDKGLELAYKSSEFSSEVLKKN